MRKVRGHRGAVAAAAAMAAMAVTANQALGQLESFPGAVGFGDAATGGRGGNVVEVTNLNSSGTGSFAQAVSQANSIVVFTVGGYINLDGEVAVANNVTILGQTSPGEGIGLMDGEVSFSSATNDIMEYVRIRQGNGSGTNSGKAGIEMDGGTNIDLNHISVQFGEFDTLDLTNSTNVTVQNSMLDDAIGQQFGIHSQNDTGLTIAYNLMANNHNRNPDMENNGDWQVINNIVYNVQAGVTSGNTGGTREEDVVNNYFITGPSTTSNGDAALGYQLDSSDEMYASGNYEDDNKNGVLDGSTVSPSGTTNESMPWFTTTTTMPVLTAANAYTYVTNTAGDSLSRDSLDQLDINQVESLGTTGGTSANGDYLYTSPSQDGLSNSGYGTITGGTPPTSTANDGIPDTWAAMHGVAQWAAAHGTTTINPAFAMALDPLGYTQIEDYANQLANQFPGQTWSAASGNWTTESNWNSTAPAQFEQAFITGNGTADGAVTINTTGNYAEALFIGGNGQAAGENVSVTAGSLSIEDTIFVGYQNNATLQITGGTLLAANVQLGNTVYNGTGTTSTTYTGTLLLSGGILQTQELVLGGGIPGSWTTGGSFTWNGGTLQAGPLGLYVNVPATIGSSGATLDTNTYSATVSGALSGPGSLTKISAGVAAFTTSNSYAGGTIINAGAINAQNSSALGTGLVTINTADGLQLGNGVNVSNTILANGGAAEVIDVPGTNASATFSGDISLESQGSDQYRVGISGGGATLTLTGQSTVSSAISLITRGNIVFAGNGSLTVANNGVEFGRFNSTSSLNLTIQNNASINATSISLGGLDGSNDDLSTTVTLLNNGVLNAGTGTLDLDNSSIANNTTDLTLSGNSDAEAGSVSEASTASGRTTTMNFNGGTLTATASNANFMPAMSDTTVNVQAGGATINNGGFNITIAQPLLGVSGGGGLTAAGAGTTTLTGSNAYVGATTVAAGTLVLGTAAALPSNGTIVNNATIVFAASVSTTGVISGTGTAIVNGGVTLTAGGAVSQGGLINNGVAQFNGATALGPISGTGSLIVGSGSSNNVVHLAANSGRSEQNSLTLNSGSTLDITNNALIINYGSNPDPITTILGYLSEGANDGVWNGRGLVSSTAASNSSYGVAFADGAAGVDSSLSSGEIEVAYAQYGDITLSGLVNAEDFSILAGNFGQIVTGGWENGDFLYQGVVNANDFFLLASNFGQMEGGENTGISAGDRAALIAFAQANDLALPSNVPEPVGLIGLAAASLLIRGRRRHMVIEKI